MTDNFWQIHLVCGSVMFLFLSYYLLMLIFYRDKPEKRIGLHVTYSYSPFFLVSSGVFCYLLLVSALFFLFFYPLPALMGAGLSVLMLFLSVRLFNLLRNLFCLICLYREGVLVAYLDGRREQFLFAEIKRVHISRLSGFCYLFLPGGRRFFLCAPFIKDYGNLRRSLEEKLVFFEFAEKYSD
jgi:hypothetical protein